MILSVFVNYWCIFHYYKCKVKYIELKVMKIILFKVIIKKKINILLENESRVILRQYFLKSFYFGKILT